MRRYPNRDDLRLRAIRMRRIRRLSGIMAPACLALAVLLTAAMAAYWSASPAGLLFAKAGLPAAPPAGLDAHLRLGAFAISMIPLGALIYGLLAARRCFATFAAGQIFSREATRSLRSFALAMAASALLQPPTGAALSLLLSAAGPSPGRSLVLEVSSGTLLSLVFAAMVAIIAWILSEATEVADENAQFV